MLSKQNGPFNNKVSQLRVQRGWSQIELARRANIPRSTVSAIEGLKITPSVTGALALAGALDCPVEDLFGAGSSPAEPGQVEWAWTPGAEPCRYWEAGVGSRRRLYPVDDLSSNSVPHDGVWQRGIASNTQSNEMAERTLVIACCDPAAGLFASEYARQSGFRLLIFPRGGDAALALLKEGLVHMAGLHRSTLDCPDLNATTVQRELGDNFRLLRATRWQEGIALPKENPIRSLSSLSRRSLRWALREEGSAARECLNEFLNGKAAAGRAVKNHRAVASAVSAGWAEAGMCVQLVAEEAGLNFLPVRQEMLDLCFAEGVARDPRVQALIRLFRNRGYRRLLAELPGYDASETGEIANV